MTFLELEICNIDNWLNSCFFIIHLPTDEAATDLIKDSVLIKDIYELWATAPTLELLHNEVAKVPDYLIIPFFRSTPPLSFRINVVSLNKKISLEDRVQFVENILAHQTCCDAVVSLSNPEFEMGLLFDYVFDNTIGRVANDNLKGVYYGRLVATSHRNTVRQTYSLKERNFLGNTSMDVFLSFIMTNLSGVQLHDIVYDPFVGTGSLLLAAAHMGARCLGMDIDYKLMHGVGRSPRASVIMRSPGESVYANFCQYGLENRYIGCLIGDAHMSNLIQWERCSWIDAIITDPPYGVREASRKVTKKSIPELRPNDMPHFPMKESCEVSETYSSLLKLSARLLKLNGKLVYWLPVVRSAYSGDSDLPSHPALRLLYNCEQILNTRTSRRLIVMEKWQPFEISMDQQINCPLQDNNSKVESHLEPKTKVPRKQMPFRTEYFSSNDNKLS